MPRDTSHINWNDFDTSLDQARSRFDGRIYPVEPLTDDQVQELAQCLGIAVDARVAWALKDATKASVRNLAAFFDTPAGSSAEYQKEQRAALERIASDPARAIDEPGESAGTRVTIDALLWVASTQGIDVEKRSGAVAVGNMAAERLERENMRVDAYLTIGEAQMFDDIIAIIIPLAPEAMTLPSNDPTPRKEIEGASRRYPAVDFAEEFIGQVVDRTLASFPNDAKTQERLHKLKAKSPGSVVKALREARARWRTNSPCNASSDEIG